MGVGNTGKYNFRADYFKDEIEPNNTPTTAQLLVSGLMRYESDYKVWKQEPKTFREWFILVSGKVVTNARKVTVKMSVHYGGQLRKIRQLLKRHHFFYIFQRKRY